MAKRDDSKKIDKYLPLTESTYYILLSLVEPLHGYGVMQKVVDISEGTVNIGPGTLYGAFTTLEKEGLIDMVREEDRRKSYLLTAKGRQVLAKQINRLIIMARIGQEITPDLSSKE
jgi:DNA-binding PadR family transcriptional regulator